jgi:hypothetical protein
MPFAGSRRARSGCVCPIALGQPRVTGESKCNQEANYRPGKVGSTVQCVFGALGKPVVAVVVALTVCEPSHPPDISRTFTGLKGLDTKTRPVADRVDCPAGVGKEDVGEPEPPDPGPAPEEPGAHNLSEKQGGHDQRHIEGAKKSFAHEVRTYVSPCGWVSPKQASDVVAKNHKLLAKTTQRKQGTGQGVCHANQPTGVAAPESIHWCVWVIFGVGPGMVVAVKPHPKHGRPRMGGTQQGQKPTHRPNRRECTVGQQAVIPNGVSEAHNGRDEKPQEDGLRQ